MTVLLGMCCFHSIFAVVQRDRGGPCGAFDSLSLGIGAKTNIIKIPLRCAGFFKNFNEILRMLYEFFCDEPCARLV